MGAPSGICHKLSLSGFLTTAIGPPFDLNGSIGFLIEFIEHLDSGPIHASFNAQGQTNKNNDE